MTDFTQRRIEAITCVLNEHVSTLLPFVKHEMAKEIIAADPATKRLEEQAKINQELARLLANCRKQLERKTNALAAAKKKLGGE
jgi:hypothetical protein